MSALVLHPCVDIKQPDFCSVHQETFRILFYDELNQFTGFVGPLKGPSSWVSCAPGWRGWSLRWWGHRICVHRLESVRYWATRNLWYSEPDLTVTRAEKSEAELHAGNAVGRFISFWGRKVGSSVTQWLVEMYILELRYANQCSAQWKQMSRNKIVFSYNYNQVNNCLHIDRNLVIIPWKKSHPVYS